jgi:ABC-type glycerol-3-phosphate transport system substrate-binding protein
MVEKPIDKNRRKLLKLSGAASAALLAGCTGDSDSEGADTGGGSSDDATIKWLTHFGSETETFNQIISEFEEDNPATVELSQVSPARYTQQFSTALGTPNAPDMWGKGSGPGTLGKFVARGVPVNLSEHLDESFLENFSNISSCRYEGEDIRSWQSPDGELYGLPVNVFGWSYWYNKEVIQDIGIDESTLKRRNDMTWQEFRGICQQAKDAGYTPVVMGGKGNIKNLGRWVGASLFKQVGVDTMMETLMGRNDRKLNDEPFVEAMRKYQDLFNDGFTNNSVTAISRAQSVNIFYGGDAAFYAQGSWMPNQINRMIGEDAPGIHEKIDYFWHPYYPDAYEDGKNELYGATGDSMSLNKQAIEERGNMDMAVEFFKHFFSQESQTAFFKSGGVPVARTDAWTDLNQEQEIQKSVLDQIQGADRTYPLVPGAFLPQSREEFLSGVGDLFSGKDPQSIMDNVESARQEDLKEYS